MSKYRKKPVVIDAIQYTDNLEALKFTGEAAYIHSGHLYIETLEGTMKAIPRDYIIKGVAGEFYPCKPDIFEATYEKVDDE